MAKQGDLPIKEAPSSTHFVGLTSSLSTNLVEGQHPPLAVADVERAGEGVPLGRLLLLKPPHDVGSVLGTVAVQHLKIKWLLIYQL